MNRLRLVLAFLLLLTACKARLSVSQMQGGTMPNEPTQAAVDSAMLTFIQPYREELEREMGEVIILSAEEMRREMPESKLTNCLADMFLENMRQLGGKLDPAVYPDMAYINYHSLRTNFPAGELSLAKLYEMFPFENQVVYLQISGENMWKFAEITAKRGGDVIAGARLVIDAQGGVSELDLGGRPFDKNKTYWIVTSDYVANGGDNMTMFLNPIRRVETDFKVRDSFIDYMREEHAAGRMLSGELDGRIRHEQ